MLSGKGPKRLCQSKKSLVPFLPPDRLVLGIRQQGNGKSSRFFQQAVQTLHVVIQGSCFYIQPLCQLSHGKIIQPLFLDQRCRLLHNTFFPKPLPWQALTSKKLMALVKE